MTIRRIAVCCMVTSLLVGCGADEGETGAERSDQGGAEVAEERAVQQTPIDPAVEARVRASMDERLAEVEAATERLPGLLGSIRQDMRRHLNAAHVAAARRNGVGAIRDSAHIAALVEDGALVQLQDSTRWWVIRELDRSLPYVTPGTQAALEDIGQRFHARLDERGVPPFRLDITSVLRTSQQQAQLRRANSNASETTSSHEFGTTLDIAYLSFGAPESLDHSSLGSELDGRISSGLEAELITRLGSLGTLHAPHLEGELGAVLQDLQNDGLVYPLRERSQPVYHITVVRDP